MAHADEIIQVSPRLAFWQAYEPKVKCDLGCVAYRSDSGWLLVDPIPLGKDGLEELLEQEEPRAVLLTNGNHERAADWYRKQFHIPVICSPQAKKDLEIKPDVILQFEETLYGVEPIHIPGATPGETAYLSKDGILMLGDCVINLGKGLELLPDKYCTDSRQNFASLQQLALRQFHTITFAHGLPLTTNAQTQLRSLVGVST
jgi:glyoxylase-like metal-dependent hydrolase (beta-lactamase superfamily II)